MIVSDSSDGYLFLHEQEELARALQERAKCADGAPVISQDDIMHVWESIPARAEARKSGCQMGVGPRGEIDDGD